MKMKHYGFFHILQGLWRGYSVARIFMNIGLSKEMIKGKVLDVGGGHRPNYFDYLRRDPAGVSVEATDASMTGIDFEKDNFPYADHSVDTIILCNVLEHMYNYRFLLSELYRIMKPRAHMIGFVPFWVGYHPDPHDYFRYTDECLVKIFEESGFKHIRITRIGGGPLLANFNTIVLSVPRVVRPILFVPYYLMDNIYVWLRPKSAARNPLGYIFTAIK